jgi:hypothetical protein
MNRRAWLVPLTGVVFIVLAIIGFIVTGEPPDAEHDAQEIVDFYGDNDTSVQAGVYLLALATIFFIFFANYLRTVFRVSVTSATILVGAAIFAVGGAFDGTILIVLTQSADDIEPTSVQTLQALWDNDFLPLALGTSIFVISLGLSILRTDVVPRWLGWVTLVIALISITPLGFFAFPLTGLLILVLSVMFVVRERRADRPPAGAVPPA